MKSIFLFCLLFFFVGCSSDFVSNRQVEIQSFLEQKGKIKVLATTEMIKDIVNQIGKEKVCSISLISKQMDPHSYELVKGDDELLYSSDLIFSNGLGLEHGASLANFLYKSSKNISLGDRYLACHCEKLLFLDGVVDPHVWMDISLWKDIIDPIVEALSKQQSEHKDFFLENGRILKEKMDQEHLSIKNILQSIPEKRRYLITSHDAFSYFTRAYLASENDYCPGIRCMAPEGLSPEMQLNSNDIKKIIDHIEKFQIRVIFTEKGVSQDSLRKVLSAANQRNLSVTISEKELYADSMINTEREIAYFEMMRHNAQVLFEQFSEGSNY